MPDSNSIDTKTLLFVLGLIAILFGYMLIEKSKKDWFINGCMAGIQSLDNTLYDLKTQYKIDDDIDNWCSNVIVRPNQFYFD